MRFHTLLMDSARWEGFEFRPDDIVISTPPKCGKTWTQMLVALLLFEGPEFTDRLDQISPWLDRWRLHSVHHSPTSLNSTNTIRFHFLEIAIDSFIDGLVMDRLGLSRDQHVAYLAVRATYAQLQHGNIDLRSGPLDHVLSTPDLHRWHHSMVYEEGDTNFGSVLSVWDKLFGTWFRPADRDCPDGLGVGRMPDFPTRYEALQRTPIDWPEIRERNAATWFADAAPDGSSR